MREYELVFIADPTQDEEGVTDIVEQITQVVSETKGEVTQVEVWGRRKLAYPIKKFREGTYVALLAHLSSDGISEMERTLKLNESVIRHLLVRTVEK